MRHLAWFLLMVMVIAAVVVITVTIGVVMLFWSAARYASRR